MDVVVAMFFLTISNIDVQYAEKELTWRIYTTKKALLSTRRVKLIDQKEFTKVVLNENIKALVIYVRSLEAKITIHLARKAQRNLLLDKKVTVLAEYLDFTDVFL